MWAKPVAMGIKEITLQFYRNWYQTKKLIIVEEIRASLFSIVNSTKIVNI